MIELVLIVQMLSGEVREIRPAPPYPSAQACMLEGQHHAAAYVSEHPDAILSAWRCGPPERGA